MSKYSSVNRKAYVGLAILVIVAVMIMGLFFVFQYIPFLTKIVGINNEIQLFIDIEDEGSRIISLLHTKKYNISYAEILGDFRASNYGENIKQDVNALEGTLTNLKLSIAVYNEIGKTIYGDSVDKTIDIALPGGFKGGLGIK